MSSIRPGTCADPGPGEAHCTERPMHDYSCYDASEDVSWNDGQWRDGWYDNAPHVCDELTCEGRPDAALADRCAPATDGDER